MSESVSPRVTVAWWNTGLSPVLGTRGQPTSSRDSAEWKEACADVAALYNRVDVLLLGEVSLEDLSDLKKVAAPTFRVVKPKSGGARPSDIGALVAAHFDARPFTALSTSYKGKELAGRQSKLSINISNAPRIDIYTVHWPSRSLGQVAEAERQALGADLQRIVGKAIQTQQHAVVVGDFNDEPFDNSIANVLQSTRWRDKASSRRLLYNPFWRLLGERRPLELESKGGTCAGTHRWQADYGGEWFTLDQMLFAPAFLAGHGWRLLEDSLAIIELRELKSGRHFPIIGTLEYLSRK